MKSAVPVEKVVMQLHAHEAPTDILVKYLELIENVDKRITLAQKLQCHKAVINVSNIFKKCIFFIDCNLISTVGLLTLC